MTKCEKCLVKICSVIVTEVERDESRLHSLCGKFPITRVLQLGPAAAASVDDLVVAALPSGFVG